MGFEELVLADVAGQHVVRSEIAPVEGEKEVAKPGVRRFRERVEDRVHEEFAEVVDRVADQCCDAEVVSPRCPLSCGDVGQLDAGEVEKGVFVKGCEVFFCLFIVWLDPRRLFEGRRGLRGSNRHSLYRMMHEQLSRLNRMCLVPAGKSQGLSARLPGSVAAA